jgi:hypothetical protein
MRFQRKTEQQTPHLDCGPQQLQSVAFDFFHITNGCFSHHLFKKLVEFMAENVHWIPHPLNVERSFSS